jgi:NodT family efflux transporter outer membrane factor (OMF) lipoprotein
MCWSAAMFVSIGAAGCVAGLPERTIPAIPATFEFGGATRSQLHRWWTAFGSLELSRLMDEAARNNLDVLAAMARVERAEALSRVAGAQLFPFLSANLDGSRSQSAGTTGSSVRPPSRSSFVSGSLAASFELDIWGRNRDQLRAALEAEVASSHDREAILLSTQGAVVNAWLLQGAANERLAIAQRNLANAERIRAAVQQRVTLGASTALELAQQDSLVAIQRAGIPPLRQGAENARQVLALLIGQAPQTSRIGKASLSGLRVPAIRPGLPSTLLQRRPDIRRAEALLASAEADVSAARKALLPTISLTASGGYQSAALVNLVRPESLAWSIGAGLLQTVFDGGRLQALGDAAAAERKELLELYRKAIVSSLFDVANALTAVRETAARETAQRVASAKAREAFGLAEQRLREGAIDLQALLITQNTLFQAEDNLVQDRLARLQAGLSLILALGGDVSCSRPPGSDPQARAATPC